MSDFNSGVYYTECESVASYCVEQAIEHLLEDNERSDIDSDMIEDVINDSILHEQIDGHEYTIYYRYHLPIIQYSSNSDYMVDNFGGDHIGEILANGIDDLHQALAFWAFYADVSEYLGDEINEQLEALETDSE